MFSFRPLIFHLTSQGGSRETTPAGRPAQGTSVVAPWPPPCKFAGVAGNGDSDAQENKRKTWRGGEAYCEPTEVLSSHREGTGNDRSGGGLGTSSTRSRT